MLKRGFSLLELLIVISIIGILLTISFPSYQNSITKTRRSEGKIALLNLSALMERYYALNNTYQTATIGNGNSQTDVMDTSLTVNKWYSLSIKQQTSSSYILHATPQGLQATNDILCATLTLDNLGTKGSTGTDTSANCW